MVVQMLQRAEPGSLLSHATMGRGLTMVFINPSNNHWRLVVLDGRQQQVILFDPLGAPLPFTIIEAVRAFVGSSWRDVDLQHCLQAESWNCGIWAVLVASRYIVSAVSRLSQAGNERAIMDVNEWLQPGDDFVLLGHESTVAQRRQNNDFAGGLRRQYGVWLAEAAASGRLLYSSSLLDEAEAATATTPKIAEESSALLYRTTARRLDYSPTATTVIRAGSAVSAIRTRRFLSRSVVELIWIDLTDDVDMADAEPEVLQEMEQSYDDLADNFIEFREDNANNQDAASLRYSLPVKFQSEVLQQQIAAFREYRRQRFSLFRRGPLVEETTVTNNLRSLLRFLGYLHYEQQATLQDTPLDMTVFSLPNISSLVLSYVEWLEQRRGRKQQAVNDAPFQPVSCSTVANYLNGLINIVKFQLCHEAALRDPLLEQLRNLRSQADSYATTQKKFEKVHPEWCSWQELQIARERCRLAFHQRTKDNRQIEAYVTHESERANGGSPESQDSDDPEGNRPLLLHLRELVLLCLFTICPPPRCSVVRLLEWDTTLVLSREQGTAERWMLDLTDLSHAASRHKTHKSKGAMRLPLPNLIHPYLVQLRERSGARKGDALFPVGTTSTRTSVRARTCLGPGSFTSFVKTTFAQYVDGGRQPNPTLLRSIFTTWLYGLQFDTEDVFLQQIKASSAQWKAHSEQIAATVYNKELIYQHKVFAQLLIFCESYSARFAHDRLPGVEQSGNDIIPQVMEVQVPSPHQRRRSTRYKRKVAASDARQRVEHSGDSGEEEYVVEELLKVRVDSSGNKQVSVRWEGYRRCTWEPYESIRRQLPEMLRLLELGDDSGNGMGAGGSVPNDDGVNEFLASYAAAHDITASYRWTTDRLAAFEHTMSLQSPPLRVTNYHLLHRLKTLVS